jgi:hypothetical protein
MIEPRVERLSMRGAHVSRASKRVQRLVAIAAAGAAIACTVTRPAMAAEIVVTSTSSMRGGPNCTLRDAITAANLDAATGGCPAGSGADTIVLAPSATYVLTEVDNVTVEDGVPQPNGLPSVTSDMAIVGDGATIARSGALHTPEFRLLHVGDGGRLTLNSLTLTGGGIPGVLDESGNDFFGGDGGAIFNSGTLTLIKTTVSANGADNSGGGIFNASGANLTLIETTVSGNLAVLDESAGAGGGVFNSGVMTALRSTISKNGARVCNDECGDGGGIANVGTADLTESTVSDNRAGGGTVGGAGGGIFNSGTLKLVRCTVSGNIAGAGDAAGNGGGLANGNGSQYYPLAAGTVTLVDCTVSGNQAGDGGGGGSGGGIFNSGTLILASCTIGTNLAGGGYGANGSGGGLANAGQLLVRNTLIAGNSSEAQVDPSSFDSGFSGPDCDGALTSEGYNLIQDPSGCTINGDLSGTITNQDPHFGPLQDNGGPTYTQALLPGSPAIDAGNPNGCTDANGNVLSTDERGAPRMAAGDTRCDIGAYESTRPAFPTITVPPTMTASATPTAPTPTQTMAVCVGDCIGDRRVTVDELVVGVNIALGHSSPAVCPVFVCATGYPGVTVACLVEAVNNALNGCPQG